MKIIKCLIGIFLFAQTVLHAQDPTNRNVIKPLGIGDTMPAIKLTGLLNYPKSEINFSEFKGKAVVLDFWFGACPSCVYLFPKMEALQKRFGERLQVLMVNFETQKQIEATMKKWKSKSSNYRPPLLPSVVEDTLLHQLFPVRYYPQQVWIDGQGVVRAVTDGEQVNEKNLTALVENKPLQLEMKVDNVKFDVYDAVLPQLIGNAPDGIRFYSSLSPYIPGVRVPWVHKVVDTVNQTVRITRSNLSALELFMDALYPGEFVNPTQSARFDFGKRVVLRVKDSSRFFYTNKIGETLGAWKANHCFTYEAVLPLSQEFGVSKIMLRDFETYFKARCRVETKRMKCLTLVESETFNLVRLTNEHPLLQTLVMDTSKVQLAATTTDRLLEKIATAYKDSTYVFANATDYKGQFSFESDKKTLRDLPALRKMLKLYYGFDLVEQESGVEVFVFEEDL